MAADFSALTQAARNVVRTHLGVPVTIQGRAVRVVWVVSDNAPSAGGARLPLVEPMALLHPDDMGSDVEPGATLARGGDFYTIADVQERADGWRTLILRRGA